MSKPQVPKKFRKEDFDPEYQDLIDKIAFVYNDNADIIYQILDKGIDYENLKRQIVDLTVTIDKNGKVTQEPQIKVTIPGRILGVNVLNAVNINNINIYPTTAPFVSFSVNANILRILNITGLQASSQYTLTLELVV